MRTLDSNQDKQYMSPGYEPGMFPITPIRVLIHLYLRATRLQQYLLCVLCYVISSNSGYQMNGKSVPSNIFLPKPRFALLKTYA